MSHAPQGKEFMSNMAGEVMDPKGKPTTVVLKSGHVVNLLLNIYVYVHRFSASLSTGQGRFCVP